jgi:hypothetical protein
MKIASQVVKGKFVKTTFDKHELTKHGIILGSTGSGKTGLGIKLLEELAVSGIPIIAIDPKGDLGNILDVALMSDGLKEEAKNDWERDKLIQKDILTRAKLKKIDATIYTPGVSEGGGIKLGIYGSSKESRSEYLKQILSLAYGYEVGSLATQYVFLEEVVAEEFRMFPANKELRVDFLIDWVQHCRLTHVGSMKLMIISQRTSV